MNLTAEQKSYLENKHRGGISNQKGNTYEAIYATKEIVRLLAEDISNKTIVSAQLKGSFVDDFLIILPDGHKVYHQLKDKQNLSWGQSSVKGDLCYDFLWQKQLSLSNSENFSLKIVYSDEDCPVHTRDMPEEIADVSAKEYFVAYPSLSVLLLSYPSLSTDLCKIINYPAEYIPYDQQLVSLQLLNSQWVELSRPDTLIGLGNIVDAYNKIHPGCPNIKAMGNVILQNDIIEIFNCFENFKHTVSGTKLYWSIGNLSGDLEITNDFQSNLVSKNPQTTIDLLQLLFCL